MGSDALSASSSSQHAAWPLACLLTSALGAASGGAAGASAGADLSAHRPAGLCMRCCLVQQHIAAYVRTFETSALHVMLELQARAGAVHMRQKQQG